MAMRVNTQRRVFQGVGNGALLLMVLWTAIPFYWMVATSLKHDKEIYGYEATLIPERPTLDNYATVFRETPYLLFLRNSLAVAAGSTLLSMIIAVLGAYAIARLNFPGRALLARGLVFTYLVPTSLLFIPMSRVVGTLGLQDTLWALVLVYPTFTVPFSTWLLMGFFKSIPRDLEDAAMVDGLTRFGTFAKLVVPISYSGILTVAIFSFTLVLQEFVYALTFISSASQQTVSVGVPIFLVRGDVYYWGSLMAACLFASVPVAIVYNLFLDRLIAGFTVGAVK